MNFHNKIEINALQPLIYMRMIIIIEKSGKKSKYFLEN
jgi:hypothetical protein